MQKKEQLFFVKNICLLIHKFLDDYGQNQISQSLIYMDKNNNLNTYMKDFFVSDKIHHHVKSVRIQKC